MPVTRKKLIEVALPLEAINVASACEKSIRHGYPGTLHLWWGSDRSATAGLAVKTKSATRASLPDRMTRLPESFVRFVRSWTRNASPLAVNLTQSEFCHDLSQEAHRGSAAARCHQR
jgi:hypothetical protein